MLRPSDVTYFGFGIVFALVTLTGCGNKGEPNSPLGGSVKSGGAVSSPSGSGTSSAQNPAQSAASFKPTGPVAPKPTIPVKAVFICDPVAVGTVASTADFASGCSLWLQWTLGFNPELIQSPRLGSSRAPTYEMKVPNTQFDIKMAAKLQGILGVSHVAVGRITGAGPSYELAYQLYELPAGTPLADSITVKGSKTDIIAQLPKASHDLLERLGVKSPKSPAGVDALPDEIEAVGRYQRFKKSVRSTDVDPDEPKVAASSKTFPVAALLYLWYQKSATSEAIEVKRLAILKRWPDNFYTLGEVACSGRNKGSQADKELNRLLSSKNAKTFWPKAAYEIQSDKEYKQWVAAHESQVEAVPNWTSAWVSLAQAYGEYGDSIRKARTVDKIKPSEWPVLEKIYRRWLEAAEQSVKIDPLNTQGWKTLSTAATFVGNAARAEEALWKGIELQPKDPRSYWWGLEMFQSKWGGNPDSLAKVARMVVTADLEPNPTTFSLVDQLKSLGFRREADQLNARIIELGWQRVKLEPNNAFAHAALGGCLSNADKHKEAVEVLEKAVRMDPNFYMSQLHLGVAYHRLGRFPEALVHIRKSDQLKSTSYSREWMGTALMDAGQFEEAEKRLRQQVKNYPGNYLNHAKLGSLLMKRNQMRAAIASYEKSVSLKPDYWEPHRSLCQLYTLDKQYDKAIEHGEAVVRMAGDDFDCLISLARAYAFAKQNDKASEFGKRASTFATTFPGRHLELGKLNLLMGYKQTAVAELKYVITMREPGKYADEAKALLEKSPP